eukprot:365026-Chlamydomonas_euryale.AAC.5
MLQTAKAAHTEASAAARRIGGTRKARLSCQVRPCMCSIQHRVAAMYGRYRRASPGYSMRSPCRMHALRMPHACPMSCHACSMHA